MNDLIESGDGQEDIARRERLFSTDPEGYYRELMLRGADAEGALRVIAPMLNRERDRLFNTLSRHMDKEKSIEMLYELRAWTKIADELQSLITDGRTAAEEMSKFGDGEK
jgi:hypothetical protein